MKEVMNKVTTFLGGLTAIMLSFVSLSIIAEVIFGVGSKGVKVPSAFLPSKNPIVELYPM